MTQEITTFGYHFLDENMFAGCGGEPAWTVGERRDLDGYIGICDFGYHASPTPSQALPYAPGPMLTLVQLYGDIRYENDKMVARSRRLMAAVDSRPVVAEWIVDILKSLDAGALRGSLWAAARLLLDKQHIPSELREDIRAAESTFQAGTAESFVWNLALWPHDIDDAIRDACCNPHRSPGWAKDRFNRMCYEALVEAQKASTAAQPAVV